MDEKENKGADDWDEVQREVHYITNDCLEAELLERSLEKSPKPVRAGSPRSQLTALLHDASHVLGDQGAVKSVDERVSEKPCPGEHIDDGGTLVEDENDGRKNGQRPVDKDEEGQLGQVGEEEHGGDDGDGEEQIRHDLPCQGLPYRRARQEIDEALNRVQVGPALRGVGEQHFGLVVIFLAIKHRMSTSGQSSMVDAGQLTGLLGPWIEHCPRRAAAWIPSCGAS